MSDDFVLSQLNEQQLDIVCRPKDENILVIAGAGTGKTRVLISRICSLISTEGVSPDSILAVTFTNKAAMEMKDRLKKAMHLEQQEMHMWIMTFHALCTRLLHMFAPQAKLPPNFSVIGPKDQQHLLKDFLEQKNFTKSFTALNGRPKEFGVDSPSIVKYINERKEKGLSCRIPPEEILKYMENFDSAWMYNKTEKFLEIMYGIYSIICERAGAVDFNELLHRTVWLLQTNEDVRLRLNNRFKHILIDEFQDTDSVQYKLMSLLKGENGRIFVVGDDDQAIYGWRGADYENLNRLVQDVPDINLLPLNINYRSTQNILNFANSLIFNEEHRILSKRLFTPRTYEEQREIYPDDSSQELAERLPRLVFDTSAPKVVVARIEQEFYEGRFVSRIIQVLHSKFHVPLSEIAVIYRKNALSAGIERSLNEENIPYQIYGGLKFYEREEILDAMAYLRLMSNPNDDIALARVYNVPKRKIGTTSWARLSAFASSCGCSVYQALQQFKQQSNPPREIQTLINKFKVIFDLIERMSNEIDQRSLPNLIDYMLHETGLLMHYQQVDREKGEVRAGSSKVENLKQLLVNAGHFMTYASLQDVNIDNMDINEILPLPDLDEDDDEDATADLADIGIDTAGSDDVAVDRATARVADAAVASHQGRSNSRGSVRRFAADLDSDADELEGEELMNSQARSALRKVSESEYVAHVSSKKDTSFGKDLGKASGKASISGNDVEYEQLESAWSSPNAQGKDTYRLDKSKDSLTIAAELSARMTLDEQASGALALHGFSPKELLNAFLRTAALTASAESNGVGQIPLDGLDIVDKELSTALQQANLKAREDEILEQAQTDIDAFKALGELKGGKHKTSLDSVQLMTIHSAKGLEFEAVIVVGCEEDNLPSSLALNSRDRVFALSEERRLAYVAFTRAKRFLVATFDQNREGYQYGQFGMWQMEPSRFLREAEMETKALGKNAPFINVPFNYNLTDEQLYNLFLTEDEKLQKAKAKAGKKRALASQYKTPAQQLAEKAKKMQRMSSTGRPSMFRMLDD